MKTGEFRHSALCAPEACSYLTYCVAMSGESHDRQGNDESRQLQISIIPGFSLLVIHRWQAASISVTFS